MVASQPGNQKQKLISGLCCLLAAAGSFYAFDTATVLWKIMKWKTCSLQLKKIVSYFWAKKSELQHMDERDTLLAKVVLDIHRKRTHSSFEIVPLFTLHQIHPINRKGSLKATEKRIKILTEHKKELLEHGVLSRDILAEYIPSVSAIKVVGQKSESYIAYEGNGRLLALQSVFSPSDNLQVEVEQYHFRDTEKIIARMNTVRKLHQLIQ